MSRAIMNAQIEAEQERAEAAFERLPVERQQAILNATETFCTWLIAMMDEEQWRNRVQDEIDALPEQFVHEDDVHYIDTLEYADDIEQREFIRWGGN